MCECLLMRTHLNPFQPAVFPGSIDSMIQAIPNLMLKVTQFYLLNTKYLQYWKYFYLSYLMLCEIEIVISDTNCSSLFLDIHFSINIVIVLYCNYLKIH